MSVLRLAPRRIAQLEPRVRKIATTLLDDFAEEDEADLVACFSAPLPTTVIAELLGVPAEDHEMFKKIKTKLVRDRKLIL